MVILWCWRGASDDAGIMEGVGLMCLVVLLRLCPSCTLVMFWWSHVKEPCLVDFLFLSIVYHGDARAARSRINKVVVGGFPWVYPGGVVMVGCSWNCPGICVVWGKEGCRSYVLGCPPSSLSIVYPGGVLVVTC